MAYIQSDKLIRPIGKTYFIPQQQMSGIYEDVTGAVGDAWSWIAGKATGTYDQLASYYNVIKNRWPEFLNIPYNVQILMAKLQTKKNVLLDKYLAPALPVEVKNQIASIDRIQSNLALLLQYWGNIKAKYDQYIGSWMSSEKELGMSGLGIAPLLVVVAVAAISAAAYVAKGIIEVIAEYSRQKSIVEELEKGAITPQQAELVIKAGKITKDGGLIETLTEKVGGGIQSGIMVAIVGAVAVVGLMYFIKRK